MEERGIAIDRQILSRLSGEFAQGMARLEAEIHELAGRALQPRLAQAARRHPVRQDGPAGREEDRHRRVVHRRRRAGGPRRAGPRAAGAHPGMAAALQAEIHLHGRPARLCPPADRSACTPASRWPRPRRAGCPPPSPTSRTSRSAPRKAARSAPPSWRRRATSWSRPTTRRSSCACWPISRRSRSSGRPSRTASTSTP